MASTLFSVKFVAKGRWHFMQTAKTGQTKRMYMLSCMIVGAHFIIFIYNGSIYYFHYQTIPQNIGEVLKENN